MWGSQTIWDFATVSCTLFFYTLTLASIDESRLIAEVKIDVKSLGQTVRAREIESFLEFDLFRES